MQVDLVIPAHNEAHRIDRTLRAYRAGWPHPRTTFTVALDACTDATEAIVRRHIRDDPRVALRKYPKLGKGGVIMESFRRSDADLIGFVDADCATPPAEMARLVEAASEADGAIASRRRAASVLPAPRSIAREVTSAGFAWSIRRLFGLPYADTQCGAKVFRRELVADVLPLLSSRDFLFDVDLLVSARKRGYRVVEVPTVWIDREGSKVSAAADTKRMAVSALRLWLHHRVIPVEPRRAEAPAPATPLGRDRDRDREPEPERSLALAA